MINYNKVIVMRILHSQYEDHGCISVGTINLPTFGNSAADANSSVFEKFPLSANRIATSAKKKSRETSIEMGSHNEAKRSHEEVNE